MGSLPEFVHEMFHTPFGAWARGAAVAQVEHKARIADGLAAEHGCGHAGVAKENFNLADQHEATPFFCLRN
jgi:hypothetical protein